MRTLTIALTAVSGLSENSTELRSCRMIRSAFSEIFAEATAWNSSGMTRDFGSSTPVAAVLMRTG